MAKSEAKSIPKKDFDEFADFVMNPSPPLRIVNTPVESMKRQKRAPVISDSSEESISNSDDDDVKDLIKKRICTTSVLTKSDKQHKPEA